MATIRVALGGLGGFRSEVDEEVEWIDCQEVSLSIFGSSLLSVFAASLDSTQRLFKDDDDIFVLSCFPHLYEQDGFNSTDELDGT